MAKAQTQLNNAITEMFETFERTLPRKRAQVKRAVGNSRLTVADILAKHADADGKIPKAKLAQVIREIQALEPEIYANLRDSMRTTLKDTAEYTSASTAEALVFAIGIPAIVALTGVTVAEGATAEVVLASLIGTGVMEFVTSVIESAFNRNGDDGKRLNERLRILARLLTNEIAVILRQSIQNGEVTPEIIRKLERAFKSADARIDTLVDTESLFAMRQTIARIGEESRLAKALKIVDFPHGEPGEHERHACYRYARADEHGMGAGVYPLGTRKIRNPHPRCRAVLQLVLVDELT